MRRVQQDRKKQGGNQAKSKVSRPQSEGRLNGQPAPRNSDLKASLPMLQLNTLLGLALSTSTVV